MVHLEDLILVQEEIITTEDTTTETSKDLQNMIAIEAEIIDRMKEEKRDSMKEGMTDNMKEETTDSMREERKNHMRKAAKEMMTE